jgi:hypothetical protein
VRKPVGDFIKGFVWALILVGLPALFVYMAFISVHDRETGDTLTAVFATGVVALVLIGGTYRFLGRR